MTALDAWRRPLSRLAAARQIPRVAGAALTDVTDRTSTTELVASIEQTGGNFTYEYDDNGNISSVKLDIVSGIIVFSYAKTGCLL